PAEVARALAALELDLGDDVEALEAILAALEGAKLDEPTRAAALDHVRTVLERRPLRNPLAADIPVGRQPSLRPYLRTAALRGLAQAAGGSAEARKLGLLGNLYSLLDDDVALARTTHAARLARLPHGAVASVRDLAALRV